MVRWVLYFVSGGVKRARKVNHTEPSFFDLDVPASGIGCDAVEPISFFGPTLSCHVVDEATFSNSNATEKENNTVRTVQFPEFRDGFRALHNAELVAEPRGHSSALPTEFSYVTA